MEHQQACAPQGECQALSTVRDKRFADASRSGRFAAFRQEEEGMRRILALAAVGTMVLAGPAFADPDQSNNNTSKKLREAVTVNGILEHEQALQDIATFTGGNRLSGTAAYDASADYVAGQAAAAGLKVSRQDFDYDLDLLA